MNGTRNKKKKNQQKRTQKNKKISQRTCLFFAIATPVRHLSVSKRNDNKLSVANPAERHTHSLRENSRRKIFAGKALASHRDGWKRDRRQIIAKRVRKRNDLSALSLARDWQLRAIGFISPLHYTRPDFSFVFCLFVFFLLFNFSHFLRVFIHAVERNNTDDTHSYVRILYAPSRMPIKSWTLIFFFFA